MSNITFVIFTKNEEKRIGYVIKNFIKYGRVLIFDDSSSDKTKEVSIELGAQYIVRPPSKEIHVERQDLYDFVKQYVKTEWIYWGYADDLLPKSLLEKLVDISKQSKIKYVRLPLYTYLFGEIEHPMIKVYSPMFFIKDCVDFTGNEIHNMGKFIGDAGEILTLPNEARYAVRHYSLYNTEKFLLGHLRYAEVEAKTKFRLKKKFSSLLMLGAMLRYFFIFYRYSFRNSNKGLITALLYSSFRLIVYARLYEIENGVDLDSIENDFVRAKNKIIDEINSI